MERDALLRQYMSLHPLARHPTNPIPNPNPDPDPNPNPNPNPNPSPNPNPNPNPHPNPNHLPGPQRCSSRHGHVSGRSTARPLAHSAPTATSSRSSTTFRSAASFPICTRSADRAGARASTWLSAQSTTESVRNRVWRACRMPSPPQAS
eukprot:scaffold49387_cov72-Phaeocystis_antarctica.AAC.5